MHLTSEEVKSLKHRIDARLAQGNLGQWETQFLSDMRSKLHRYGTRTRMTEKQSARLYGLVSGASWTSSQRRDQGRYPYRRRYRPGFVGWLMFQTRKAAVSVGLVAIAMTLFWVTEQLSPFLSDSVGFHIGLSGSATPVVGSIRVIDGDTVDVAGEHFRLIGLNTPETFEPRCSREYALGMRAKERLGELLSTGTPALTKMRCACPPGTEGTDRCNYGRSCGVLTVNGTDVAKTLVGEGLAVAFYCGETSCPPLPRPWCN